MSDEDAAKLLRRYGIGSKVSLKIFWEYKRAQYKKEEMGNE